MIARCPGAWLDFLLVLGFLRPVLAPIAKKFKKEELQEDKIVDLCLGKSGDGGRYFVSAESIEKICGDIDKYVAFLALSAAGKLEIKRDKSSLARKNENPTGKSGPGRNRSFSSVGRLLRSRCQARGPGRSRP